MQKKFKKETIHTTGYRDWDKIVHDYFGNKEYDCVQTEAWGYDSAHNFYLEKREIDEYEIEELEKFKSGKFVTYITPILLQKLINDNMIKEGIYCIEVCW